MLPVDAGQSTRQGLRSSNQDRVAVCSPWAFILDGVGGSKRGGAAAQIALGALLQESAMLPTTFTTPSELRAAIHHLIESAQRAVRDRLGDPNGGSSGSTTLSLAHLQPLDDVLVEATIASVGDSPVWIASHGSSPVLVSATRGGERSRTLEGAIGWAAYQPRIYSVSLPVPGRLVMATDGLLALDEVVRSRLLTSPNKPQECAAQLTQGALQHGGRDNVTVLVLDVGTDPDLAEARLG